MLPPGEPLPFRVHRSRMGNLPIYSDTRSGGSKVVTVLRKYQGDVDALSHAVSRLCESDVQQILAAVESPHNGLTFCAGSHAQQRNTRPCVC